MSNRWLGPSLALVGILLVAIGIVSLSRLLAAPLEAQRGYLAQTVFPLVVGLALFVGGLYASFAGTRGSDSPRQPTEDDQTPGPRA